MNKKLAPYLPNIEKGLISLIILFTLLNYLISDVGDTFFLIVVGLEVALILIYFIQLEIKPYALLWLAFLLAQAVIFIPLESQLLIFVISMAGYIIFGVIVLVKTFKYSYKTKNFELLNFIMGFLLIIQVVLPFISKQEELLTFYRFAITFSIGTIVYNDNLWHRYEQDEKNIMKYILVIFLVSVLQSSLKYLNI